MFNRKGDVSDVVLDEQLRTRIRTIEELRRGDIAQIAHKARPEKIHKRQDVFIFTRLDDCLQALEYQAVIVVLACGVLAPAGAVNLAGSWRSVGHLEKSPKVITMEFVKLKGRALPLLVELGVGERFGYQGSRSLSHPPRIQSLWTF